MKMNMITTGSLGGLIGLVGAMGLVTTSNTDSLSLPGSGSSQQSEEKICLLSDAPFFEGVKTGCYSKSEIAELSDRDVVNERGASVTVVLTSPPESAEAWDDCRTCNDYRRMRGLGWIALSGKDQRREDFFGRACGMLDYLKKARQPEQSYFAEDGLSSQEIAEIPTASLIQFSAWPKAEEGDFSPEEQINRSNAAVPDDHGNWVVKLDEQWLIIQSLAHADFNEDGIGDMLVFMRTQLNDGTAFGGHIGYLTRYSADGEIKFQMLKS